jgi:hypothetical protein
MVLQLYEGLSSEGLQANEQQFASSSEDDLAFTSNPARLMTMACERRRTLSRYKTHDGKVCRPRKTRVLTVMAGMWRMTRTRGSKGLEHRHARSARESKSCPLGFRQDLTKRSAKIPTISTGVIV